MSKRGSSVLPMPSSTVKERTTKPAAGPRRWPTGWPCAVLSTPLWCAAACTPSCSRHRDPRAPLPVRLAAARTGPGRSQLCAAPPPCRRSPALDSWRDGATHAKVVVDEPAGAVDRHVARVRVGMEEAVTQDLLQVGLNGLYTHVGKSGRGLSVGPQKRGRGSAVAVSAARE
eukprot:358951-Chlamydomonas_euryale.AAC.7